MHLRRLLCAGLDRLLLNDGGGDGGDDGGNHGGGSLRVTGSSAAAGCGHPTRARLQNGLVSPAGIGAVNPLQVGAELAEVLNATLNGQLVSLQKGPHAPAEDDPVSRGALGLGR